MKESMKSYYGSVTSYLSDIVSDDHNKEAFKEAGKLVAGKLAKDELVYLVGPGGHSNMTTEECLCRAGMPVQLSPMIDCTNLIFGTTKTRFLQRTTGYATGLLDQYYLKEGDVLIVTNSFGINCLCVDLAIKARERGVKVIAVTSAAHCTKLPKDHPARHPSKKNLMDVADVYIDAKMPYGDVSTTIEGVDQMMGPVSTILNVFAINMLMISAVEELVEMGVTPKIWRSINLPGGDSYDEQYFRDYGNRIKYLL